MATIRLKNGADEDDFIVTSTMMAIERLCRSGMAGFNALYDLVQVCRDPSVAPARSSVGVLLSAGLLNDGTVHAAVKNVVLSAAQGDGMTLAFCSPVA